jgi:hypothetical protein
VQEYEGGYQDRTGNKSARYLQWLHKDLEEMPGDPRTIYYLGHAHIEQIGPTPGQVPHVCVCVCVCVCVWVCVCVCVCVYLSISIYILSYGIYKWYVIMVCVCVCVCVSIYIHIYTYIWYI